MKLGLDPSITQSRFLRLEEDANITHLRLGVDASITQSKFEAWSRCPCRDVAAAK